MADEIENETEKKKGKQGFASMSKERRREIARLGGQSAQRKGTAHRWTSREAQAAGEKGGKATSSKPGHMALIGSIGGSRVKPDD